MISENMEKALNAQINKELYSSYLYLSMSAFLQSLNLNGFGNWMSIQAQEETAHAMAILNFIIQRGGKVKLEAIDKPPTEFNSVLDVFETSLAHEIYVSSLIHKLADYADEERDRPAQSFLKWYIDEQVEEEANAQEIVVKLKFVNSNPGALLIMDREMAQRMFVQPIIK